MPRVVLMCIINADGEPDPESLPRKLSEVLDAVCTIPVGMESSLKIVQQLVEAALAENEGEDIPLVKIELGKSQVCGTTRRRVGRASSRRTL